MDVSTSAATIRPAHHHHHDPPISAPSSPHSSSQYSPSTSISSLPSVSSSFFFSSAAASPPHSAPHSDHGQVDLGTHGLIIPSLALPAALRPPTVYGKTLGELRLLVLAGSNRNVIEEEFFTRLLSEDNADVVDVGGWEGVEYGRVVRASTDWVEHQDGFGIEKFEPTRNIEVVDLGGYEQDANVRRFCFCFCLLMMTITGRWSTDTIKVHHPRPLLCHLGCPRTNAPTIPSSRQPRLGVFNTALHRSHPPHLSQYVHLISSCNQNPN